MDAEATNATGEAARRGEDMRIGGTPATGDVMAGEYDMISGTVESSAGQLARGMVCKADNNPYGIGTLFSLVNGEFGLDQKRDGTNSIQIKRGEPSVFWIVLNVFSYARYGAVSGGGFKYQPKGLFVPAGGGLVALASFFSHQCGVSRLDGSLNFSLDPERVRALVTALKPNCENR